jgi:hypothetical protein
MKTICFLPILLLCVPSTGLTQSTLIRSPFGAGNARSPGPFLIDYSAAPSARWQQVYGASDFARVGAPMFITEIRFETALNSPGFVDTSLANLRIDFSTTARVPDGLSSTFAENIGANDTVVFSGPFDFTDYGGGFGIHIPLQTPFLFDPAQGNLLMDVRNLMTGRVSVPAYLRSEYTAGDSVSVATSLSDANSLTGSLSTLGLETLFTVTPIPEPSTVSLLILGTSVLGLMAWKRSSARAADCRANSNRSKRRKQSEQTDLSPFPPFSPV